MRFTLTLVVALFLLSLSTGTADAQTRSTQLDVPLSNGFRFVSPPTGDLQLETPEHRSSRRLERGLLMGGGFGFLASYLVNAGVGAFSGVSLGWGRSGGTSQRWDDFRIAGLIPFAGPWIQLALKPTSFANDDWGPFLITTGLLQAASLGLLIAGVVVGAGNEEPANVQISPWADRDGAGLTASGTF